MKRYYYRNKKTGEKFETDVKLTVNEFELLHEIKTIQIRDEKLWQTKAIQQNLNLKRS